MHNDTFHDRIDARQKLANAKAETGHTSTPWTVNSNNPFEIVMADDDVFPLVATINADDASVSPEQAAADAAFIVKAANCHDAMLAALKAALADFGSDFQGPTIDAIRAAVASAA